MAKMGRPKADNPRTKCVLIRFTEDELSVLQKRASKYNLTIAEKVRKDLKLNKKRFLSITQTSLPNSYLRKEFQMETVRKDENLDNMQMVECHYNGAIIKIPVRLFLAMTFRLQYDNKKFVRYKEGAQMYGMSEREFYKLAHDAEAVYKRNKMALVKVEILDKFMEFYKEG